MSVCVYVLAVRSACTDHVYAAQVPAGLHVSAPCAAAACSSFHGNSDHLSHWSLGHKNYQRDLNHFSSHGLCCHWLLPVIVNSLKCLSIYLQPWSALRYQASEHLHLC